LVLNRFDCGAPESIPLDRIGERRFFRKRTAPSFIIAWIVVIRHHT
jgi:hypothetical protein